MKFVDWKIAVEISGLTVELDLLSADHLQSVSKSTNCSTTNIESYTSAREKTDATFSSMLKKKFLRLFSRIFRSSVSYLFSCFTIVVKNCIFELQTVDGDCIQVISK